MWLSRLPECCTYFPWQMKWREMLMLHKNCAWHSIHFSSGHCLYHTQQQMDLLSLKSQLQYFCCFSKSYSSQAGLKKLNTFFFCSSWQLFLTWVTSTFYITLSLNTAVLEHFPGLKHLCLVPTTLIVSGQGLYVSSGGQEIKEMSHDPWPCC